MEEQYLKLEEFKNRLKQIEDLKQKYLNKLENLEEEIVFIEEEIPKIEKELLKTHSKEMLDFFFDYRIPSYNQPDTFQDSVKNKNLILFETLYFNIATEEVIYDFEKDIEFSHMQLLNSFSFKDWNSLFHKMDFDLSITEKELKDFWERKTKEPSKGIEVIIDMIKSIRNDFFKGE